VLLIRRVGLAFLLGAATVLAFAPFSAWPVAIMSLAGLFTLWLRAATPFQAALIGLAWGLGLFLFGVSWLFVSLHVYGEMPAVMAAISIFLFCAYLALYPALAGYLQARLQGDLGWRLLALMPAVLVGSELLRAWVFSGFPWLTIGYSQTPSAQVLAPLAGYAPIVGVFGISALLAVTAGAVVLVSERLSLAPLEPVRRKVMAGLVLVTWSSGVFLLAFDWSQPSGEPVAVSLTQGNVEQHLKWRADQVQPTIDNYLGLVSQSRGKLIVLPETALPMLLDEVPNEVANVLRAKALSTGADILMGIAYREPVSARPGQTTAASAPALAYFNGAVGIRADDTGLQRYAKHHLVAFGEFVPPMFSWVYQWLTIPLSGFTPGDAVQAPMRLAGHSVAVNICYEDTFGHEIARPLPQAELLVNVSNMAWYGRSLAADQHLQFSQMRALETGRWMLRSTNTGATAAVDDKGRVVAALPQFTRGVLEVSATPRKGTTPYVIWRDWPVWLGVFLVLAASLFARRRKVK
jgi:apolipoprotein N-acyltransferase